MKRAWVLILTIIMLLTGCAPAGKVEEEPKEKLPTDDGMLNILMIGNSFSYYYTDELYRMLESAGIAANVCNVYYSGCSVQAHSAWLKSGAANYQFVSESEGGGPAQKAFPCNSILIRMWQLARASEMIGDTLCNKNGLKSGDNYHDGDTGGGQFLNACVWYEVITGESCLENEFVPMYGLEETKITAIKEAAHQAVQNMGNDSK